MLRIHFGFIVSSTTYLHQFLKMSIYRGGLFSGKVALVTGGSTGIGKAITTELLHLGMYALHKIQLIVECELSQCIFT